MTKRYRNRIFGTTISTEATNLGVEWEPIADDHTLRVVKDSGLALDPQGNPVETEPDFDEDLLGEPAGVVENVAQEDSDESTEEPEGSTDETSGEDSKEDSKDEEEVIGDAAGEAGGSGDEPGKAAAGKRAAPRRRTTRKS